MTQTSPAFPNEFDMEDVIAEVEAHMETLVTEDDTPVDNIFSDYQQRLLIESLRSTWQPVDENGTPRKYLALSDVAIYYGLRQKPVVPDVLLSLDVEAPTEWWRKKNRSYFMWEFIKPPELVIEIVSNRVGKETGEKLRDYAVIGVDNYVIFDPGRYLEGDVLRVFKLRLDGGRRYIESPDRYFPGVGLGVTMWEGSYEDSKPTLWLRWCDDKGELIATGAERSAREAERAALLASKLRELGVDPDQILSGER
jgi:Uma2 family endonuclease